MMRCYGIGAIATGGFVRGGLMGVVVVGVMSIRRRVMAGRVGMLLLLVMVRVVGHSRVNLRVSVVGGIPGPRDVNEMGLRVGSALIERGSLTRNEGHGCPIDHLRK